MRNKEKWKPGKFVFHKGKLVSSKDLSEVSLSSRPNVDLVAQKYQELIDLHVHGKLIDLGCGKVPLYEAYKNKIVDNICVDWDQSPHSNEFLDFNCDLSKTLPFEDEEFDTLIISDVLEHIPNPEDLWKEMARILKSNGKILLNVPFFYWIHESPHDFYRYTEFALRRFAENNGFKVIELTAIGGVPEILSDLISKTIIRTPYIGKLSCYLFLAFSSFFNKSPIGRKISSKTKNVFPLAYFLVAQKK